MPTLSASDYTRFLKYRAANVSPIRAAIQTRDNVALSQSIINANLLTSQAAFVTTPSTVKVLTSTAVVTDASTSTVTDALTDIITGASGGAGKITYTTSVNHGLTTGTVVEITGMNQGTLSVSPNQTGAVTVTSTTQFTIAVAATGTTAAGNGSITGRVYYTTNVAHGLVAGDVASITGFTAFNATSATVLAAPTATTFVLSSTATGTAESGATARIVGFIYYTTDIASGLSSTDRAISISGLSTSAFNLSLVPVDRTASSTVFRVASSATGTAVTGASGVLTLTTYTNSTTTITGNARVIGQQVVQTRATATAKSTLSWTSGTSGSISATSSSKVQRPGGLPTGFKNSQGTYHRIPQSAGW